jgi:hypothetical protein
VIHFVHSKCQVIAQLRSGDDARRFLFCFRASLSLRKRIMFSREKSSAQEESSLGWVEILPRCASGDRLLGAEKLELKSSPDLVAFAAAFCPSPTAESFTPCR